MRSLVLRSSVVLLLLSLAPDVTARRRQAVSPYPPSTVIKSITWDQSTWIRMAPGSDLWPNTWGPDGNVYVSWGDGGGFGGTNSSGRVAMGFARVEGGPTNFTTANVNGGKNPENPASFPSKGKTGSFLSVNGTFYCWLNAQDNSWPGVSMKLIWSGNLGATWQTSSWSFPPGSGNFKPAAFLNYGQDYAGARDNFVYFYGRNETSSGRDTVAYLGRVPKGTLTDKNSFEYFTGFNGSGNPTWSPSIGQRKPVFQDSNGVGPINISYNPTIKRYLMTIGRDKGGRIGIFDAPEPWGPWTTVAYYDNWIGANGNNGTCALVNGFVNKWTSPDGLTMWMIFSVHCDSSSKYHDHFNLIKANLTLSSSSSNLPPSVNITQPTAGATFTAPANVQIDATASDTDGQVLQVEFLVDGAVVGSDTTVPYSFSWNNVALGTYSLTARATDDKGAATLSSPVSITVSGPPPPAAPSNLVATAVSPSQIDLSWQDNSSNETSFVLEGATGAGPLSVTLATYNGANTPPTVEAAGSTDSFQVGALVVNDRSDTWTAVPPLLSGTTRLLTARNDRQQSPVDQKYVVTLSGPTTIYLPADPRYGGAPLSWMDATWTDSGMACDSSALSGWTIWKKTISAGGDVTLGCDTMVADGMCYAFVGGGSWSVIATLGADVTTHSDTGLTGGTTYSYRVKATNANGDSPYSNIATATTPSSGPDTDGDGLPDAWEQQYFGNLGQGAGGDPDSDTLTNLGEYNAGTDPMNPDTDGDGLTDAEEVLTYGTNPTVADSDGDGMLDGDEVTWNLDPLNGDQDGNGTVDGQDDWNGNGIDNQTDIASGTNPGSPPTPPPGPAPTGGGGSSSGCGATGIEGILLLGLLLICRRWRG